MPRHATEIEVYTILAPIDKTEAEMFFHCYNPYTGCAWNGYKLFSHTVRHDALWESSSIAEEMWRVLVDGLSCTAEMAKFSFVEGQD